jgi:hypothetical protein
MDAALASKRTCEWRLSVGVAEQGAKVAIADSESTEEYARADRFALGVVCR